MSDLSPNEERDLLAAEYVLGLLDGPELVEAQRLEAGDPEFAAAVAAWSERLAPLFDEIEEVEPPDEVWRRIEGAIAAPAAANDNDEKLRRKLRLWRGYAAGVSAIAASLALVVGYEMTREQAPVVVRAEPVPVPVMVATLSSPEAATSLSVAYDRSRGSLLVTPGQLSGAAGHDHELWIIPAGGSPVSLGLIRPGAPRRIQVPAEIAPHFQLRAGIALSVEPTGGSPTGQPTGPVVAAGELLTV